jgi:GT2 family glycosyltransferase
MTGPPTDPASERAPSVLVVLVTRDAARWLRGCLAALAEQRYPRLGILAVDDASTDDTAAILVQALGERRVVALRERAGFAGAIKAAAAIPAAREADHLLVLHDDTALDPDAVSRMVEAAHGIGVEGVGIVGPKVVDWRDPRLLLDVGRSADRFGHPYTPLQPGEIDQGQFDRVLEVLCASSCAMLISRDAWSRVGLFDERLDARHGDLDLCWRARMAGFKVLMTPLARVRHRRAGATGERDQPQRRHSERYYEDRAALASLLKNASAVSLLWLLPLDLALTFVRLVFLLFSRRFEESYDLLAAWTWNLVHVPGTIARRVRAQSVRSVRDRELRRFMEATGVRLPRWFESAGRILEEQRELDDEDAEVSAGRRLRDRTASLVGQHPVFVASTLAIIVGAVAFRSLIGPEPLAGGALPTFPSSFQGFFAELLSGFRTTALGGTFAASPALGLMGGISWLAFASTAIAQKVMLAGGVALAGVLAYRAVARRTGRPSAAAVAAAAYVLSALLLWSFSEGRIGLLAGLAVLPPILERLEVAFGAEPPPQGRWRFAAGLGVTLAVGIAFTPGVALAVGVLLAIEVVFGRARLRGLALALSATAASAVLLFPFVPTIATDDGAALGSGIGTTDLGELARLAPGGGPGSWIVAAFLPFAAVIAFALVGPRSRAAAGRAMLAAVVGLGLAWCSGAGYLPASLANAPVYLGLAAVGEAFAIGYGLATVLGGLGRESFGLRQVGTGLLALVLGVGITLQAIGAMVGGWEIGGPAAVPAAWAVTASEARGDFRVLWVGSDDHERFPAPGGDPLAVAPAGRASIRYAITGRDGALAVDTGRVTNGGGVRYLADVLNEILSGTTEHGGALLAPLGVRFVVAGDDDLPPATAALLDRQIDLDLVLEEGLRIYRNGAAMPPAAVVPSADAGALASADLSTIAAIAPGTAVPLRAVEGGWAGTSPGAGLAQVGDAFGPDWELLDPTGSPRGPRESFGWSLSFPAPAGTVRIRYTAQAARTIELVLLGALWLVALWTTRRPVSRYEALHPGDPG